MEWEQCWLCEPWRGSVFEQHFETSHHGSYRALDPHTCLEFDGPCHLGSLRWHQPPEFKNTLNLLKMELRVRVRVCWSLSQLGRRLGHTLNKSLVHRRDTKVHIHAYELFGLANSPYMHVFRLWEETGENPRRCRENMQTPLLPPCCKTALLTITPLCRPRK